MRVLVCGGRDYTDEKALNLELDVLHSDGAITLIIEGGARGADNLAAQWADSRRVERIRFPADWERHGKSAGPIRNKQMLDEGKPDLVIAFPGGRGTQNMIQQAIKAGVKVITVEGRI